MSVVMVLCFESRMRKNFFLLLWLLLHLYLTNYSVNSLGLVRWYFFGIFYFKKLTFYKRGRQDYYFLYFILQKG